MIKFNNVYSRCNRENIFTLFTCRICCTCIICNIDTIVLTFKEL